MDYELRTMDHGLRIMDSTGRYKEEPFNQTRVNIQARKVLTVQIEDPTWNEDLKKL